MAATVSTCDLPSRVGACPVDGGTALLTSVHAVAIAADDNSVYAATDDGRILSCAIGGCNHTPTVLATGQTGASFVAVDATTVYWSATTNGTIMACSNAGCGMKPTTLASAQIAPGAIDVSPTNVLWMNAGPAGQNQGTLVELPKRGGTPLVLAKNIAQSGGIFAGGPNYQRVYWADTAAGTVTGVSE